MQTAQMLKTARENRAAALDKVKALSTKIENRTWQEDTDGPALEQAKKELEGIEIEVGRLETMLDIEARAAGWTSAATGVPSFGDASAAVGVTILPEGRRGDSAAQKRREYRILKAIREVATGRSMTGLELEMAQEAEREARQMGVTIDGNLPVPAFLLQGEKRDMLVGTTTAGGYTVQTEIGDLIPLLDPRPVVRRMGATFLTGLTGNIDFPRNDAGASAVWATEVATATETSPTFDRVQMSPNRLAAFTDVSKQVMIQSTIGMENFVRNRLTQAVSNALDTAALFGAGGAEPTGISATSGINAITVAASPTWAKIVEFETSVAVDDADFGNLAYLTHPAISGTLKTKEKASSTGQFIWMGANNGQGQLNGYNAYVSTLCAAIGGAYPMFFGNWQKLIVGQWGGLDLMVNPYTKAKEALVEVIVNSWWDVAVEHPVAFAYSATVHAS